ncbi:MAG: hypothetical protein JW901_05290 [Dehalococcoidia bacterium]|nr:hypothetical protein [Dehalococcoidia bacterium]
MMYEVEVEYRGKLKVAVFAEDRDDAASQAVERVERMDKGLLDKKEFEVTGTFAETMSNYDRREAKVADLI